jgi:hypothetical protein
MKVVFNSDKRKILNKKLNIQVKNQDSSQKPLNHLKTHDNHHESTHKIKQANHQPHNFQLFIVILRAQEQTTESVT